MFIDYNLFGMNFVNVDAVKFRLPLPDGIAAVNSSISGNSSLVLVFSGFPLYTFAAQQQLDS